MSELRKAAQMALEALDSDHPDIQLRAAITLRAALAQERSDVQPEPVLYKWAALFEDPNNDWQAGYEHARRWVLEVGLQSIAAPPQRKPLTEDELETAYRAIWRNLPEDFNYAAYGWIEQGIRYAEREHGIGGEE